MIKIKIPHIYSLALYKQILCAFLLMIVIFIVGYRVFLELKEETYFEHMRTETKLKEEYINKYAIYKNLSNYELQNKKLITLNKQLIKKFPNEIEIGNLMFNINQLGKNNFIQISKFQPLNMKADVNGLLIQVVEVNLSGEYINFLNFMVGLYTLSAVTNITNLNIIRNSDSNITVSFNLNIHFYK